ncbi:unnamed protein product [Pedinophyceae sp. YPF-701]|nr:unnamed protein product [Pedinophyceae sp. YPF-701]
MSYWKLISDLCAPPAIFFIILLQIPRPRPLRRAILLTVKTFLGIPVFGVLKLVHLVMGLTFLSWAFQSKKLYEVYQYWQRREDYTIDQQCKSTQAEIKGRKWRFERNWWIALFIFVAWAMLARFYAITVTAFELEEHIGRMQEQHNEELAALRKQVRALGGEVPEGEGGEAGAEAEGAEEEPAKEEPASSEPKKDR